MNTNPVADEKEKIFCSRCGRPLRGRKSRELGYGPSCYAIWKKERSQQLKLFEDDGDKHE